MKIFSKKLGIVLAILFLGTCISFFCINYFIQKEIKSSLETSRVSQVVLTETLQKRVIYQINKGDGEILEYQAVPSPGATVFSLLEELAQREDFELSYKNYPGMGVFVESIQGVKNGTDNKYWQYWVNDKLGEVAADKKEVKAGDKIEWRFEVPPEFF